MENISCTLTDTPHIQIPADQITEEPLFVMLNNQQQQNA